MKVVFISDQKKRMAQVYGPELLDRLAKANESEAVILNKEDVLERSGEFQDTEFIFSTWGMPVFTEEEIKKIFPSLKCLFYGAGSVQRFARQFLNCGVRVFSAWMANAVPVAEYTVAQILLANKGFFTTSRFQDPVGRKAAKDAFARFPGNYDTKVGIIGTGAIGRLVCELLKPFRLKVIAYSRSLTEERAAELGVEKSDVETIFKTCQVVSNHLANNEHTQGFFKEEHFASMVPDGVFINTGRGAQVVEEDLIKVLTERPDLTAVLDVTMPEPPVEGSPFYSLPNCVLTPHIAGSSGNEVRRMSEWMEEEYLRYCAGEPLRYEVSMKMLETMA